MAEIVSYAPEHFDGLDRLWREAFPDDPPRNRADVSVPAKMKVQPELLLVAVDGAAVVGSIEGGSTPSRSLRRGGARGSARRGCGRPSGGFRRWVASR